MGGGQTLILFISRPTVAIHLCARPGQKTGFGALRKYKSDAPDAMRCSCIHSQCVCGGDDDDDDDDDDDVDDSYIVSHISDISHVLACQLDS